MMWARAWVGLALLPEVQPLSFGRAYIDGRAYVDDHVQQAKTTLAEHTPFRSDSFDRGRVSFLLISSASEQKVSYVELDDSRMIGEIRPLVDAGLSAPHGLARTNDGTGLFVADSGLRRIVYYGLKMLNCIEGAANDIRCGGGISDGHGSASESAAKAQRKHTLVVEGAQTIIVEGVLSDWVAVDSVGALYFTDQEKQSVNRIPAHTVKNIAAGLLDPSTLSYISQYSVDALAVAQTSVAMESSNEMPEAHAQTALKEERSNHIASIFQAGASENVGTPGGLVVDDEDVYWTNMDQGRLKGTVSAGLAAPLELPALPGDGAKASAALKSRVIINKTESAYGLAISRESIVFTDEHVVYGVAKRGGAVIPLSGTLSSPRGLAWDGDFTMFVADELGSTIYSFPCGKLAAGLQFSTVVRVHRPVDVLYVHFYINSDGEPTVADKTWRNSSNLRMPFMNCMLSLAVVALTLLR